MKVSGFKLSGTVELLRLEGEKREGKWFQIVTNSGAAMAGRRKT